MQDKIDRILSEQLEKGYISREDTELYRYGYILAAGAVINAILALVIGIVFRELWFVMAFHLFFVPMRVYCGGWHASSRARCTLFSSVTMAVLTVLYKVLWRHVNVRILLVLDVMFILLIAAYKPNAARWKRVNNDDIARYARMVKIQLALHIVLIFLAWYLNNTRGVYFFVLVHGTQTILILLDRINSSPE